MDGPFPHPDPLGLPVPVPILFSLKVFGFILHAVFMNLWLAGLPAALVLLKCRVQVAKRLFRLMPFFMAFGINAGIVPLLFLQTLYPQFFYPATILQAWFWFLVIPLLMVAYCGVYLVASGRLQMIAGLVASSLLIWIGFTFSAALSLTASPERWPSIFLATSHAGSVHGAYLYLETEVWLRFLLMLGMAFGTVAAFLVLDANGFVRDPDYKTEIRQPVLFLYSLGFFIYGIAGSLYAPMVVEKVPRIWWLLAGASMPVGEFFSAAYCRWPGRKTAFLLAASHFIVILSNAVARQMVQFHDMAKWVDLEKIPVREEWGSFILFGVTLVVGVGVLAWIGLTAHRAVSKEN